MDRIEQSNQTLAELLGEGHTPAAQATDPELQEILSRFIFGDVFHQGVLTDKERELITLVVLTANGTTPQLAAHTAAALHVGLTPVEIREAVYQCAPYTGFPKVLNALREVNAAFAAAGIALPAATQGTVEEDTRFEKGLAAQKAIFGEGIDTMRANAPEGQRHIQDYLSAFCFGDFYTRGGLELPMRELLTLCVLSALGGCENQVRAHIGGNLSVGNSREKLVGAITQCLPYMGFPRTLNALACINETAKA